jgi:hypothetical protein
MKMLDGIRETRRSGRIASTVVALFALRAIVPIGYMPASIGDGGPFVLCHGSSAATLAIFATSWPTHGGAEVHDSAGTHGSIEMHGPGGMHHSPADAVASADSAADSEAGDPTGSHDESWEQCELGVGSAGAALATVVPMLVVAPASMPVDSADARLPVSFRAAPYRARAPPA